jgi:hypothetical protein
MRPQKVNIPFERSQVNETLVIFADSNLNRQDGGVLDGRLNVFGTEGLKVVDLSICPDNLGTNTYSSALLVGEKGADLLAEDLGIQIKVPHYHAPHEKNPFEPYRHPAHH